MYVNPFQLTARVRVCACVCAVRTRTHTHRLTPREHPPPPTLSPMFPAFLPPSSSCYPGAESNLRSLGMFPGLCRDPLSLRVCLCWLFNLGDDIWGGEQIGLLCLIKPKHPRLSASFSVCLSVCLDTEAARGDLAWLCRAPAGGSSPRRAGPDRVS